MRRPYSVIPNEDANPARTDRFGHEILAVRPRASPTPLRFAENDGVVHHDP